MYVSNKPVRRNHNEIHTAQIRTPPTSTRPIPKSSVTKASKTTSIHAPPPTPSLYTNNTSRSLLSIVPSTVPAQDLRSSNGLRLLFRLSATSYSASLPWPLYVSAVVLRGFSAWAVDAVFVAVEGRPAKMRPPSRKPITRDLKAAMVLTPSCDAVQGSLVEKMPFWMRPSGWQREAQVVRRRRCCGENSALVKCLGYVVLQLRYE